MHATRAESAHASAGTRGGVGRGEEMFFGEAKERVSGGESNHQKRSLLEVPSMGDRLTKAGCGYVCQSHMKKAS